ncbi:uncharacterized protein BJ212DRAFT_1303744 [Suillus subaureus]|uniref:Secreted protein n=1 Tax=Suillus subaureus TaxID=48587 RepID=A0A9P7DY61_9AGAM|nr:uncharacterized protein BJ212DRAFT_1303744 [Suillus subaureus]KAG1806075.1 hypothetical protein BJ212DRAFT_1303744 [Suillus subaureus]
MFSTSLSIAPLLGRWCCTLLCIAQRTSMGGAIVSSHTLYSYALRYLAQSSSIHLYEAFFDLDNVRTTSSTEGCLTQTSLGLSFRIGWLFLFLTPKEGVGYAGGAKEAWMGNAQPI